MIKHITGGGSSYADAVKKSGIKLDVVPSREKCLFVISNMPSIRAIKSLVTEDDANGVMDEYEQFLFKGESGGSIVFSLDVNAATLSTDPVKNWLLTKFYTIRNRFTISGVLKRLRNSENIAAWTIGKYLTGSYTANNGKNFDEESMVLDVIGVDRKTLFKLAEEIRVYLKQESVLVKDATTHQIYFVDDTKI